MTVSIGGVNIGVGADIAPFLEGIDKAEKELRQFSAKMARIRLEGIFTRDAEKATEKYLKTTGSEINKIFKDWSRNISDVKTSMGRFADYAKQSAYELRKAFGQVAEPMQQWLEYSKPTGAGNQLKNILNDIQKVQQVMAKAKTGGAVTDVETDLLGQKNTRIGSIRTLIPDLEKIAAATSKGAIKHIGQLKEYLEKDINWQESKVAKFLKQIQKDIEQRGPIIAEEYEKLGKRIRKAMIMQDVYTYKSQLAQAQDAGNVIKRQVEAVRSLNIEEAKAQANISKGFDVQKNRNILLENYQRRLAIGRTLTQEQVATYQKLYQEKMRLQKADVLDRARYEAELRNARDITQVSIRRAQELRKLNLEIERYRKEISASYHVDQNKLNIMNALQQKQRAGLTLSKQEIEELRKLTKERTRLEKGAGVAKEDSFFSKEWFINRARWFIQLRLFWEVYRQLATAMSGGLEFEQQMAEVRAVTQASGKDFEELKAKALEVGIATRFSGKEAAEGMTTLAQAGLSTKEILVAIADVAVLASATMYDFKQTAELVTSIMRAWGFEANNTKYITDVLATSINKTRLTMEGLSAGMSYISAIAPQLNISLEDSVALFGALANKGISFSIAATSIRAMLDELLDPTSKFVKELAYLGIGLDEIDPKTNNIIDILTTLKEAGWDVENSFKAFERRAATGVSALVDSARSVKALSGAMYEENRAALMSVEQLHSISAQWKQFQDVMIETADAFYQKTTPFLIGLIELLKDVASGVKDVGTHMFELISIISSGITSLGTIVKEGTGGLELREALAEMKKMSDEIQNYQTKIDETVGAYIRLKEAYDKFIKNWQSGKDTTGNNKLATKRFEDALNVAQRAGIITRKELDDYKKLSETVDGRVKVEVEVERSLERQKQLMNDQIKLSEFVIKNRRTALEVSAKTEIDEAIKKLDKAVGVFRENKEEIFFDPMTMKLPKVRRKGQSELAESKLRLQQLFAIRDPEVLKKILEDPKYRDKFEKITAQTTLEEFADLYSKVGGRIVNPVTSKADTSNIDRLLDKENETNKRDRYETRAEIRERLSTENDTYKAQVRILDLKRQEYKLDEVSVNSVIEIMELTEKREALQKKIAANEAEIARSINENEKPLTEIQLNTIAMTEQAERMQAAQARKLEDQRAIEAYHKGVARRLEIERDELQNEIDTLNKKAQQLVTKGVTAEEEKELLSIYSKITELADERAQKEFYIADLTNENTNAARNRLKVAQEENREIEKASNLKARRERIDTQLKQIDYDYAKKQYNIEKERMELSESVLLTSAKDLELSQQQLSLDLQRLEEERKLIATVDPERELKIRQQILDTQLKLKQVTYDLARAHNPLLDAVHKFRTEYSDVNKDVSNIIYGGFQSLGGGLSNSLYDITGGFQSRQQEAADLKEEVRELNVELAETQKGINQAITDQDEEQFYELSEQANQITQRMKLLNQEIARLDDPMEGAKDSVKDFFKTFVDELRKAIIQMLVFKMIASALGMFVGRGSWSESSTGMMIHSSDIPTAAHGGILPQISSFRKFSSGGITGSPTIAMLGDNKSGRELVIPEENIRSNNVSGYVRDKKEDTINIVNVLTREDVAMAMASVEGERVIINTIGKDMMKNGPIYKQIRR